MLRSRRTFVNDGHISKQDSGIRGWVADTFPWVQGSEKERPGRVSNLGGTPSVLAHSVIKFAAGRSAEVTQDINVLALVKGEERYVFLYDDSRRAETLRTLGRFASNPDLSFSWYDAAVLSQKVRQNAIEAEQQPKQRFELPQN